LPIYPNLSADFETRIKAIEMAAAGVEDYLDTVECPYSSGLRDILRKVLNGAAGEGAARAARVVIFDVVEGDKFDVLLREVETTIEEMKSIEAGMDGKAETGDRIALIKAKTSLLEKWATLKERVLTLKEMSQFQIAVIGAMDEILDVDQRSQFRARLRNLESVGDKT
jgi:hypothetical protein